MRLESFSNEELWCLKRSVLIETLAAELPTGTVQFGCQVIAVKLDALTSYPMLQLHDGTVIRAKVNLLIVFHISICLSK